jgi:deoxyribonuclease-4
VERGIELIADVLNQILKPAQTTMVLLETMSGKGSEVGGKFEEIGQIIDQVQLQEKLGVCLDTCHIFDAGYDIIHDLDGVLAEFDRAIGLHRLQAIHLNDSKNPFASHKDRHEKIGEGTLGLDTIIKVINHPQLKHLPFYLETPNELEAMPKKSNCSRLLIRNKAQRQTMKQELASCNLITHVTVSEQDCLTF